MIGLIDPAFFLPRSDGVVEEELSFIASLCKKNGIEIVPINDYWHSLWSDLARPLERSVGTQARQAVQQIRKLGDASRTNWKDLDAVTGRVWRRGFRQLFQIEGLDSEWELRMASAVVRLASLDREIVLIVRRMEGRNVKPHSAQNSAIEENIRWVLHIQPAGGQGHKTVLCVHHPRNLSHRWTTRFDWRLPNDMNAKYPFYPPDLWWKSDTGAVRTIEGKPAWIDKYQNGWARPNIPNGAGYHWDVFVRDRGIEEAIGLSQVNVVEYGAPTSEGRAGSIHHIPEEKRTRFKDVGWRE